MENAKETIKVMMEKYYDDTKLFYTEDFANILCKELKKEEVHIVARLVEKLQSLNVHEIKEGREEYRTALLSITKATKQLNNLLKVDLFMASIVDDSITENIPINGIIYNIKHNGYGLD